MDVKSDLRPTTLSPLARRLAISWGVAAIVIGTGLLIEDVTRHDLDGTNPIRERVGFAYNEGFPIPDLSGVVEGKRTAVLFVRPEKAEAACSWAAKKPITDVTMVVVVPEQVSCSGVTVNVDKDRELARGLRMRRSTDGGYPVGFAILDSNGELRYNTLHRDFWKASWWDRQLYNGKKYEFQTILKEVS